MTKLVIGVPTETKDMESRVGLTPEATAILREDGHVVLIEADAGVKSGYSDEMFEKAGARIVKSAAEVYEADVIIKVKEPLKSEYYLMRKGLAICGFFHFPGNPELLKICQEKGVRTLAYEEIVHNGRRPILAEMSKIAGKLAVQEGLRLLSAAYGGKGLLAEDARVTIIGAGNAGLAALQVALKQVKRVMLLVRRPKELTFFSDRCFTSFSVIKSTPENIVEVIRSTDLLIGAVAIPKNPAPKIITRKMIRLMEAGSVFVDISIDEGGCSETSRVTSHSNPTYIEEGVVHYCVPNMPGVVPKTSTPVLVNAALPYIRKFLRKF